MNRFQFVEDHKDAYGVKRLCEVIEIARSSFYAWLAAAPGRAARAADDARLAARIRACQVFCVSGRCSVSRGRAGCGRGRRGRAGRGLVSSSW